MHGYRYIKDELKKDIELMVLLFCNAPTITADLIDHGIVLCGGGALVRGMDQFVREQTGLPARLAAEPLTAVVRGLLICLEHFEQWRGAMQSGEDDV